MPESADIVRKDVAAASEIVPEPVTSTVQDAPPVSSGNQEPNCIKPPLPSESTVAAANPFNDTSQRSSPLPPTSSYPETQQNFMQRSMQEQHRPPFPPLPGQMAASYPYSNR